MALGECRSPLKKLSEQSGPKNPTKQTIKQTKNRKTAQKGKEEQLHCACNIPSPRLALLSVKGNFPTRKSSPHWGRENRVSNQLPQPSGICIKVQLWFLLTQRPAKLRCIGMAGTRKKGRGYQYPPCSWRLWFPVPCSAKDPSSFHH